MDNKNAAGWLIVHTEGKEKQSFTLKEGKNRIGRKTSKHTPDVPIDNDIYVSRNHAIIVVRHNDKSEYEYLLVDNAELLGKPSLNGTYLNGDTERIGEKAIRLNDGDTVQVGITKLVLKTAHIAVDVDDAIKLVEKTGYAKTVEFENSQAVLRKTFKK